MCFNTRRASTCDYTVIDEDITQILRTGETELQQIHYFETVSGDQKLVEIKIAKPC